MQPKAPTAILDRDHWKMVFNQKGAIVKRLIPNMVLITIITALLIGLHLYSKEFHDINMHISGALPGYMGAALGLLLVFRNNTAYERWWEARKEIGALVNNARNLAIGLNGLLPDAHKEKTRLAHLLIAFVFAMRSHLRNSKDDHDIDLVDEADRKPILEAKHRPNVIANQMMGRLEELWQNKLLTDIQQSILIERVMALIDIVGKCERIKNTPIPSAYSVLLKFFINLYVIILPFALVDEIGWACIPLILLMYYILMSIVLTAEEIEEPFGKDLNDLQMDALSNNIKTNVLEIITHH